MIVSHPSQVICLGASHKSNGIKTFVPNYWTRGITLIITTHHVTECHNVRKSIGTGGKRVYSTQIVVMIDYWITLGRMIIQSARDLHDTQFWWLKQFPKGTNKSKIVLKICFLLMSSVFFSSEQGLFTQHLPSYLTNPITFKIEGTK